MEELPRRGHNLSIIQKGLLTKRLLRKGSGGNPSLHARCLVHFTCIIKISGETIMDTRREGSPLWITAGRDSVLQGAGLNLGAATMEVGEIAIFEVHPDFGYGSKGNFSFPSVPPNAWLEYAVELLGFEPVEEGKLCRDMLFEERLEAAERRRKEGNVLFQREEIADALGKYSMSLSYLNQDFMFQLQGSHEQKANAVRLPTLLNISACQLQMADYEGAIDSASQVLATRKDDGKALFRRGKALRLAGKYAAAAKDFDAAGRLMPNDSAVRGEIKILKASIAEDRRAGDAIFKGVLGTGIVSASNAGSTWWQKIWADLSKLEVCKIFVRLACWLHRRQHRRTN